MAKIKITSDTSLSNSGYHRCGQPNWWVRIGDRFFDIGRIRGDEKLSVEVEVERHETEQIVIHYGVGQSSGRDSVRGSMKVRSKTQVREANAAKQAASVEAQAGYAEVQEAMMR